MTNDDDVIRSQIDYYSARAPEYDDWFYRRGRYDRGTEHREAWLGEMDTAQNALRALGPVETALELACGTGIWTEVLTTMATHTLAIDASEEVIALNRKKLSNAKNVEYRQADLFKWHPQSEYDLVVCAFWLSHVPPERLDLFLDSAAAAVRPGGTFFTVDSWLSETSTALDGPLKTVDGVVRERALTDGRSFQMVKVFYELERIESILQRRGFRAEAHTTGEFFWYATAQKGSV